MSIIENKITFPTKLGKIMGLILIILAAYIIQELLERFGFFTSIWVGASVWGPALLISFVYVYYWIKEDEKNNDSEKWLKLQEEHNNILKEKNNILHSKYFYNPRR